MKPLYAGLSVVGLWMLLSLLSLADAAFSIDLRPWGEAAALMLVAFLTAALYFIAMPPGA